MALTINTQPFPLAGTGRPIIVRATTNNWITTAGVLYARSMTLTAGATAGQTLILSFNGGAIVVTMTAAATPDSSGTQFTSGTTTASTIAADLNRNFTLNYWFVITSSGTTVTFTARQKGTAPTITFSGTYSGYTLGTATAGVNEVKRSNFQALLDVWLEVNAVSFGDAPIAKLAQTPDANGQFVFDISTILDAYMVDTVPTYGATTNTIVPKMVQAYKIFLAESYGIPAAVQAYHVHNTPVLYAIRSRRTQAENANNANSVPESILSGRPVTKHITTDQKEYLHVCSTQGGGSAYTTSILITFTDGTTKTHTAPPTTPSYVFPAVFCVPTGYAALGIAAQITGPHAGKTVAKYSVKFSFASSGWEPEYTYIIADKCPTFQRYFLFRNSRGGWDTLRCAGIMSKSVQVARDAVRNIVPANYTMLDTESAYENTVAVEQYDISTGFLFDTQAEAEYFAREFLASEAVYWDNNGRFEPVTVTTTDARVNRDRQRLFGFSFSFRAGNSIGDKTSNYWK